MTNISSKFALFSIMTALCTSSAFAQYATGGTTNTTSGGTTATGNGAIAVGGGNGAPATARETRSVAIGDLARANCRFDTALGNFARAEGIVSKNVSVHPCFENNIPAGGSSAIGYLAIAKGYGAVAMGNSAAVNGTSSIALGSATVGDVDRTNPHMGAVSDQSIAIGSFAKAGIEMGSALRNNSIAIGAGSNSVIDAIAVGGGSFAYGDHSMAIGPTAMAGTFTGVTPTGQAPSAIALGTLSKAKADSSLALGAAARADDQYTIAVGKNTVATNTGSSAIGSFSTTENGQANDVALGSASKTNSVIPTTFIVIGEGTYYFAGNAPLSTVSIGKPEEIVNGQTVPELTRTMTHVAAGRIADDSTDAINGSQLYALIEAFEAHLASHP